MKGRFATAAQPDVVDLTGAHDVYVERLGNCERTEFGGTRFVLCVKRRVEGTTELRAVVSLIYPAGVAEVINSQVRQFLAGQPFITAEASDTDMLC